MSAFDKGIRVALADARKRERQAVRPHSSEVRRERCPSCGRPVRSMPIDDTDERVLVSGRSIMVAIKVPGLEGYTTAYGTRVHECPRRKP